MMATGFSHEPTHSKLPSLKKNVRHRLPPRKPCSVIAVLHGGAYWSTIDESIRTRLMKSLPTSPPPSVAEPMRHMISAAAPLTIAPLLCVAACELVGGEEEQAMDTASALHLVHAAAYTRNRLPAFGGRSIYPAGVEMLTGDGLLALGYELVARSGGDPQRVVRVIKELVDATGPQGMMEGRLMEGEGGEQGKGWPKGVVEKKEGRLGACGAACGAILGGGSEEEIEKVKRFGLYGGMIHGLLLRAEGGSGDRSLIRASVEEFRSLARVELEGFAERKRDKACELLELCGVGGGEGREKRERACV